MAANANSESRPDVAEGSQVQEDSLPIVAEEEPRGDKCGPNVSGPRHKLTKYKLRNLIHVIPYTDSSKC